MENRLKERLTGAAILVALVVLLVPEMFRGQRDDVAATDGGSGEGPPVRTYTIDLSNGGARAAPVQSAPASTATATPVTPATLVTPVTSAAPAAVAAAPSATQVAAPASPAPSPLPATPGAASAAAASTGTASARAASTRAASAGWGVQLGLFAKRENAERLMQAARAKGFAVSIAGADAKGLFRVHSAGLADRNAAQALQQRLKAQGLPAAVIAPQ